MITEDGQIKIMDFGLAKLANRSKLTQLGTTLGTAAYMSPEQSRGENTDHRSDIWSLGVVLYEMLTGQVPFKGDYEQAITYSILHEDQEPITALRSRIPMELERVVNKCLQKVPASRYQHADELSVDLQALQNTQKSGVSTQTTAVGAGLKPAPARKLSILLGLAAILILVVALTFFMNRNQPIDSIAVLPFVNSNNDPDLEYLSDGLTETLINKLSQLPQLRVMARSTVFHFKGQGVSPLEVGRELGVKAVLSGNIVQRGGLLRLQAELVDISDGTQIWGAQYNPTFDDIFSVQNTIAEQITSSLRLKLTRDEKTRMTRRHTEDAEAYQFYLKGRFYWNKRTAAGFDKAIDYFQQAAGRDPNYALAYAGQADCYALLNIYGIKSAKESFPIAKAMALKALELDPQLGEAHTTLGFVQALFDWDWTGSEASFKRAIELNPSYATTYHWYGAMLLAAGRVDEAVLKAKQALQLDPLSLIINSDLGNKLRCAGKYALGIEALHKALDMDPEFHVTHLHLAEAYRRIGNLGKSVEHAKRAVELENDPRALKELGLGYAASGKREEALQIVVQLEALAKIRPVSAIFFADIYRHLGDKNKALDSLEQAVEERSVWVAFRNPALWEPLPINDLILADPRFKAIARKVGWPQ